MGTYYRSYIGPFLRMPITNKPISKKILVDINGEETSNKFDPLTGEENVFVTKIFNEEVRPYPYIDDETRPDLDDDAFCSANHYSKIEILFYPNTRKWNLLGKEDTEWNYYKSLIGIDPEAEMFKFQKEYKAYLDYFEKEYGKFQIDYGIIREGN